MHHQKPRRQRLPVCSALGILLFMGIFQVYSISITTFELPVKSEGSLTFYVDLCQFEGREDRTTVEVIYSIDVKQLLPDKIEQDSIHLDFHLEILDTQFKELLDINERKAFNLAEAAEEEENYTFVDLKRFSITADTLQLHLTLSDSRGLKKGLVNSAFVVKKFSGELSVSDPLFLSHLQRAGENSVFVRSGLVMVPDPRRLFRATEERKDALVYMEINHLSFDPETPSAYTLAYSVKDLAGKDILTREHSALPVSSENTARVEKIPLQDFISGVYSLNLRVTDLSSGETSISRRYFRVYSDVQGDELLLPMSKEDAQKYYDQIKYIASDEEKKLYQKLSPGAKQEFLLQFWKSKDPLSETPENEFMEEHFRRIAYCEENFKGGINSDMGRVYITYGPPLDVRREFSNRLYTKPVEVWVYAINGSSEFIFVDRIGGDQYVLVHSTHPDEFSNPDWENDVR